MFGTFYVEGIVATSFMSTTMAIIATVDPEGHFED